MLLVLFILIVICSIVGNLTTKAFERSAIDQFFIQLTLDIQRMQTLAIKEGVHTTIVFYDNNTYKGFVRNDTTNHIVEMNFPKGVRLNTFSNLKRVSFDNKGEVSNFGKIIFFTPEGYREVIVNIEKGRIKINECKRDFIC